MAGIFNTLGNVAAKVELAIAKQLGLQITFKHRNNSAVPVWVQFKDRNAGLLNEGGIQTSERMATIIIATGQTGFTKSENDAEPVIPGDIFTYNGREFHVVAPIESNKYSSVYVLHAADHKALDAGTIKG